MSAVQTIRAKSGASPDKARAIASKDDDESDAVAPASGDTVEENAASPAPPPPGLGKLVDKTI
jgi:hypothetical protein